MAALPGRATPGVEAVIEVDGAKVLEARPANAAVAGAGASVEAIS